MVEAEEISVSEFPAWFWLDAMERISTGRPTAFVEYIEAHAEPESNIYAIELGRTLRAIALQRRSRIAPGRPL
jgi:hypothetical protein